MNERYTLQCKDDLPIHTIQRIRNQLVHLGLLPRELWFNNLQNFYSVHLQIFDTRMGVNGKGVSYELALASAYGELMERMQNQVLYSGLHFDPDVLAYKGFLYAPDELRCSVQETVDAEMVWLDLLLPRDLSKNQRLPLVQAWSDHLCEDPNQIVHLPFYQVSQDRIVQLPATLVRYCYTSNGMCAGNTPTEALVQGLSEIIERYINKRIYREKIVPPTIPDDVLRKYPLVYRMIRQIRSDASYELIVKDCSLCEGWPVVAVILINKMNQTYFVKFGAHPFIEVALERTLTELLQGKDFYQMNDMKPFRFDNQVVHRTENFQQIFADGCGFYPNEFFETKPSYPFTEPIDYPDGNNQQLLTRLLGLIRRRGYDIFIRDVSFLGFPSYQIIVPGFSEVCEISVSTAEKYKAYDQIKKYARTIQNATPDQLTSMMDYLTRYHFTNQDSLADLTGLPTGDDFLWKSITTDLFLSAVYYKLREYQKAYHAMNRYIQYLRIHQNEALEYYRCARDYIGTREDRWNVERAEQLLLSIYSPSMVEQVIKDLIDPDQIFHYYGTLWCWDCERCTFQPNCSYEKFKELHTKLKAAYAENVIDQMHLHTIFHP